MRIARFMLFTGALASASIVAPVANGQGIFPKGWTDDEALTKGLELDYPVTTFGWGSGSPPRQMEPVSSHICLISYVSGNFAGAAERVAIEVDGGSTKGPRWILTGTSGQSSLSIGAICVPKSAFTSGMLDANGIQQSRFPALENGSCGIKPTAYNPTPSTALFIRSIAGRFRGGGEVVSVIDSPGRGIGIGACSGYVGGALQSVAMQGPEKVWYFSPGGRTTTRSIATFSGVATTQGAKYFDMVSTRKAICGLTSISGKFENGGDSVSLTTRQQGNKPVWAISLITKNGGYLAASFTCLARDQR